jgi:hypothetical protein
MDCRKRFVAKTFVWYEILFARCPKCQRMDLNGWSLDHYPARGWMKLRMSLGAKKYRCEYCRLNFVSSRRRKERFTFHRWEHRENYYKD